MVFWFVSLSGITGEGGRPLRVTPSRGDDTRLKLIFRGWILERTLEKRRRKVKVVRKRQLKRSSLCRGRWLKKIVSFLKEKIGDTISCRTDTKYSDTLSHI